MARTTQTADVSTTSTSYANITGLSFPVLANKVYRFRFIIDCTVTTAGTHGGAWCVTGPASPTRLAYKVTSPLTATTETFTYVSNTDYTTGAMTVSANLPSATGNIVVLEGTITPSVDGTVTAQHLVETGGTLVAKIGSTVEYNLVR